MTRTLTITTDADWKTALRTAGARAGTALTTGRYQGETLNFESPAAFFTQLNERRWQLLQVMLGHGTTGVRALARQLGRDVKAVHTDTGILVQLGLLEKDSKGALCCPYDSIHIDMLMAAIAAPPAA